jgi:NADPH:quinone reductase-like Zn-dependent oxidoreductase
MKAAYAKGGAGIDQIEIREVADPSPGPGEAVVRFKAATLNFRDLQFITGRLSGMTKEPDYVPLSCATGEVVSVADDVTRVKPGDRVSPIFSLGWIEGPAPSMDMLGGTVDGVARQQAAFNAESLVLIPDELGDLEAATLPCAGLTAWSALFGPRPLQRGEWIVVQGTGGVSIAALQWAKAAGANVAITSSSDAKLHRAKSLGADIGINYRSTPDWAGAVRSALGGKGVDIIVDTAGANEVGPAASLLNEGGIVAAIGNLAGDFSWGQQEVKVAPIHVGNRQGHQAMIAFAAQHKIRPVVDVVYDLDRVDDALRHMQSGDFFGKVGVNLL